VSLLNWQNTIASLGASITAPIFTAGRLRAGVEQAQAQYRQSLAQYEQTVLVAYREVEDQLTALHYLADESESETRAVTDAQRAEEIALERYKAGLVGDQDVVYAEQTVLTDEQTEPQISGRRIVASVALIKALGGGWKGQPKQEMRKHILTEGRRSGKNKLGWRYEKELSPRRLHRTRRANYHTARLAYHCLFRLVSILRMIRVISAVPYLTGGDCWRAAKEYSPLMC